MLVKRQERFVRMMSLYRVSEAQIQLLLGAQQDDLEARNVEIYGSADQYLSKPVKYQKRSLIK
ncbi:hypothetical protein [Bacillus sp. Bos-x628]|uniref:hypothetical protein n=1 Tax=Bacillus maqinnsis TaxID=3229854 RepID=UPI00338F8B0C